MVVRLNSNNNPFERENPNYQDVNDTNTYILKAGVIGHAQGAYQTLQSNNVYENKDFLATDEFVDSNGTNNTVNAGATDSTYNSTGDLYSISPVKGSSLDLDSTVYTSTSSSKTLVKTHTINATVFEHTNQIKTNNVNEWAQCEITFLYEDGTTFSVNSSLIASTTYVSETYTNPKPYLEVTSIEVKLQTENGISTAYVDENDVYGVTFTTGEVVICDTGTLTLDGAEKGLCVYTDATHTSNTSMTVKAGDGTLQTSAQTLVNNAIVFDISSLGAGTLDLEFALITSDVSETPTFKGWGVYLIK